MKRQAGFLSCLFLVFGLASCNIPVNPDNNSSTQEVFLRYQTVSVFMTETAEPLAEVEFTQPPMTLGVYTTSTRLAPTEGLPAVLHTPQPAGQQRNGPVSCDLAQAGRPIDVTIPDDSLFLPGKSFSKTWRLVNAGSCTWDDSYSVVWFSGDDLGVVRAQLFNTVVPPGKSVDVTVDLVAPKSPGAYQSNWKLRNNKDVLFGIGPDGTAPFWVRIEVLQPIIPTDTVIPPTPTSSPEIYASGLMTLTLDTRLDLDSGQVNQEESDDLLFTLSQDGHPEVIPQNGARLLSTGEEGSPGLAECQTANMTEDPVLLDQLQPGRYLCFRTTEGLPGRFWLPNLDQSNQRITLDFVTWAVP